MHTQDLVIQEQQNIFYQDDDLNEIFQDEDTPSFKFANLISPARFIEDITQKIEQVHSQPMRPVKLTYLEIHNGLSSPYFELLSSEDSEEEGSKKLRISRQSMQDFDKQMIGKLKCTKKKHPLVSNFEAPECIIPNEEALLRIHKQYQGIKEGYLEKQKNGMIKVYQKRYFLLTNSRFFYFNDEEKMKFKGVINFKLAKSTIIKHKEKHFKILMDNQKGFNFRSGSQEDIDEWVELLKCVVSENNLQIIQTNNPKKYLECDTVTEQEFFDCAETGDILLFETNNVTGKIQRGLTGSKYDHVGMVIKFDENDLRVFDSSSDNGVSLLEWNQYIRENDLFSRLNIYNQFILRVVFRKLNYQNKQELQKTIFRFVGDHLGEKYLLNAEKLLKFKSILNNQLEQNGFFCSELIAKVLKKCELLDPTKSSSQYWPVDFAQERTLNLLNDATLSNEITIILSKDILQN